MLASSSLDLVDLGGIVRDTCTGLAPTPACVDLECAVEADLPLVVADAAVLRELVDRLARHAVAAIGGDWGAVTLATGVLGPGGGVLARPESWADRIGGYFAYVEVHSTGPAVGGIEGCASQFGSDPFSAPGLGPLTPDKAADLLSAVGGDVVVDPYATAGTSVLLLLPYLGDAVGPVG